MAPFSVNSVAEVRHTLGQHTAVTRAGNGDILAMYGDFTDQMEGQTGYLVRSRDGGESWGEPELALRPRWWRGGTHTSLGMQTLGDGRILLPWTHGESLKHNPTGRTRFVCLRSDDHGRSWQGWDEQALPFHRVSPYGTIVELADGTLLCPACGQPGGDDGYLGTCFVLRSSDRGVTWGEHSFICHGHPNGASETDVTLLPDGRLLALIRAVGFPDERPSSAGELPAPKVHWVDYAHSEDGGRTWSEPRHTDVVGQNMNAWVTAHGTLIAACRGIDGTSLLREEQIRPASRRYSDQVGYGIHFFTAEAPADGSRWRYRFTLPDPNGLRYSAHHQSGEPSMCNLRDGRVMVVYYSYDESIFCGLGDENCLNPLIRSEMERIPHVFKRRPCRALLTEGVPELR